MKRRIGVVTGTRAEFGILKPLLKKIEEDKNLDLKLLVTGMHLLKKYGSTINEIKDSGFDISATIDMYDENLNPDYHGKSLARSIEKFTNVLLKIKPDILIVLGDRLEALAATLAAAILKIPIAHIQGGDKTDSGHIDESIRHSITRFANIHFTATQEHSKRLIKTGEESWRIFKVGSLGLDSIIGLEAIDENKLSKKTGINVLKPLIICLFHPVSIEVDSIGEQIKEIMESIDELKIQSIIIYPNNDVGSEKIISEINKYDNKPLMKIVPNLSHFEYISLLKYAGEHQGVLVGNSSSGIIEAPSFKLPVINIGARNVGREHAENAIFIEPKKRDITEKIEMALYNEEFRKKVKHCVNPYGDGKTSERIVKVLNEIVIDKKLLQKKITY